MLSAVRALGRIGDRRAGPAIEAVLRRWHPILVSPRDDLFKACDQALKSLQRSSLIYFCAAATFFHWE
jgi:hypothetical protein